jgi:anthranilate phosphoribosyltransferase
MSFDLKPTLDRIKSGRDLSADQTYDVFHQVMSGTLGDPEIKTLLELLAQKGESVDELVGAARAMRQTSIKITCNADAIDTCGTGGDGVSTFNVSTTAAIIAAAAGATVAKHGNTSTTRKSGSTEVMRELGIDTDAGKETVERCLSEIGIGYLNARLLHPAMRHAASVRKALPIRTIFNLLGPLTNPAGARRQLLGVPKPHFVDLVASALIKLGVDHAWVIHGDGLCDVTITGSTTVAEIKGDSHSRFTIAPEDVGLNRASMESLLINSPAQSASVIRKILDGEQGPRRDHTLMNAGAALLVAGVATDHRDGIARAASAIDSGAARDKLTDWSNGPRGG